MLIFNGLKLGTSLPKAPAIRDLRVTHYNDMLLQMNVLPPTLHMIRMGEFDKSLCQTECYLATIVLKS